MKIVLLSSILALLLGVVGIGSYFLRQDPQKKAEDKVLQARIAERIAAGCCPRSHQ
ncbi:hypothetical protein MAMC_01437 [Methylacidimicrobium cyclopophantes]|uniref:Uncharacterized protein n=1 Tax=Methylacidimicrobium cyclopophantes TaxID=1041766 RepID=A0A5E6MGW6_9BACT|nr:hypothetical protein [Methylacidimicrobium cyclopophantes]VVM07125.1 hypothetical protein MAMC_01437 [Methylacidimicrobium cyclopophantes]